MQHVDLHRFRKRKNLTQGDIADAIGLDRSRISKYESGKERTDYITDKLITRFPEIVNYVIHKIEVTNRLSEPIPKFNHPDILTARDLRKQIALLKAQIKGLEIQLEQLPPGANIDDIL
jgi:transcriptional regulator with XRE-family HTH domain